MKFILSLIAFLTLTSVFADEALDEFGKNMSFFYLEPTAAHFKDFQNKANTFSGTLKQQGNGADLLVAVMIARISEKNDWPIEGDSSLSKKAREILDKNSQIAKYVNSDSAADPGKIDVWWASFFATGDTKYLSFILNYAGDTSRTSDPMVTGSATWSFKSNCKQHKAVKAFAEKSMKNIAYFKKANFLSESIKEAEQGAAANP